jgi:hypothetical protein
VMFVTPATHVGVYLACKCHTCRGFLRAIYAVGSAASRYYCSPVDLKYADVASKTAVPVN